MKTLEFNFSHPFKGRAIIKMLGTANTFCKRFMLDSKESDLIETPLNEFRTGKYEVTLDWEVDDHLFTHQQKFEINATPNIIEATS